MLVLNILSNLLPKLMILYIEFSGRDFRNKIRDYFAFSILLPPMEPDRSSRKMYSPLYASKLDLADLGGNRVTLMQLDPVVQIGLPKSDC